MRINLVAPFAEKDAVKALGARWDGTHKVWYIQDVKDLSPFMKWIPDMNAAVGTNAVATPLTPKAPAKQAAAKAGVITRSTSTVTQCDCSVLPWDDCVHSRPA
jgi:hypothetical protein